MTIFKQTVTSDDQGEVNTLGDRLDNSRVLLVYIQPILTYHPIMDYSQMGENGNMHCTAIRCFCMASLLMWLQ